MNRRLERDLGAWLEAETHGANTEADDALGRVFRHVERQGPRAGFAHAVLEAAGFAPSAGRASSAWLRLALVGSLVSACLVLLAAPWLLMALKTVAQVVGWPFLVAVWHGAARAAHFALACWSIVGDLASALRLSAATPTGATIVFGNLLIAAASLFGLKRLLVNSRSFSNAS